MQHLLYRRRRMPLDPKQRHRLLLADRTKDVTWIAATIANLLAKDPDVTLDEIEDVLRAAASTAYLVGTAERFEVVVGYTAWRDALTKAGMTPEQNLTLLAAEPIRPAMLPELRARSQLTPGGKDAADLFNRRRFRHTGRIISGFRPLSCRRHNHHCQNRCYWPFAPERAMASDVSEVDNNNVIAGGVTAANLPADFRKLRRSSTSRCSRSSMAITFYFIRLNNLIFAFNDRA